MRSWKKQRRRQKPPADDLGGGSLEDVTVMQVAQKWGPNKSAYFEDGDSGTSSDEEHYVQSAIEEERKHLSSLNPASFRFFSTIGKLSCSIDVAASVDSAERSADAQELRELRRAVTGAIRDVADASRVLRSDFGDSEADQARRELLLSLVTNGCFYLHLVGSGFKSPHHPALRHMAAVRELLRAVVEATMEEEEEERKEEEEERKEEEEERKEVERKEEESRHVPKQLRTVPSGCFRAVNRTISAGMVITRKKDRLWKNPRARAKIQYGRAAGSRNAQLHKRPPGSRNAQLHKRPSAKTESYPGQISGIDPTKRKSIKLRPPP
jgi:hypothetical protein